MRLGRNFTNLLEYEMLSEEEQNEFDEGDLSVADMDARVGNRIKRDVERQLEEANQEGLRHVELDAGIPNPYLEMEDDELESARQLSNELDVTLSLHLPYTFVANSTCSFQEEDRATACEYMKRYIDVADKLGCDYCVMHPGSIPYYQAEGTYLDIMEQSLIKSLKELGAYCEDRDMLLHLENNTQWDVGFVTKQEVVPVLQEVRDSGVDVRFCFDLAHIFTQVETSDEIPEPPEKLYRDLPEDLLHALHIGDYVPEEELFHPPIHRERGKLKRKNFENMAEIFEEKGIEVVIIETAVRERDDLRNGRQLMQEETEFLADIFNR
ncbi:MAG: sugar phosphate isomerase/epimerase family protein [bacterium]